ncbi:MAG: DMT family transporter [Solirubrobacteraceae bacterium]|jgi:drug/metabolite transporter (DMT)-like permease
MLAVLLALAAAFLFAAGSVLQQKAAATATDEEARRAGFLLQLARRPAWLAGIAMDALGFACQATALGVGRIIVVQPLLTTTMVFALPLGARVTRQRVGRRQIIGALAVTVGVAAFLLISRPAGGRNDAPAAHWLAAAAPIAAGAVLLLVAGAHRRPALKAAMLGTAAGLMFGLGAALTKATVDRLDRGVLALVLDWHLYAVIVVGYVSMTLIAGALQTRELAPAIATSMSLDALTSILLGSALFGESIRHTPGAVAGSVVALMVMFAGLAVLARAQPAEPRPPPVAAPSGPARLVRRTIV